MVARYERYVLKNFMQLKQQDAILYTLCEVYRDDGLFRSNLGRILYKQTVKHSNIHDRVISKSFLQTRHQSYDMSLSMLVYVITRHLPFKY